MTGEEAIRPATRADVPSVLAIERQAFPRPWSDVSLREELGRVSGNAGAALAPAVASACFDVATHGSEVVGYVIAWGIEDALEVARIAVDVRWRRRGIARSLLEHVREAARSSGARFVALEARENNEAALSLYRSLGFTAAGRRRGYYCEDGERLDACLFVLPLERRS